MSKSSTEIEIKLPVPDRAALLRALKSLGARPNGPRVHEMNVLFDTADGRLAKQGQIVRIRIEHPSRGKGKAAKRIPRQVDDPATFTFKGPVQPSHSRKRTNKKSPRETRYKVREELEVRVVGAKMLERLLRALGLQPWFRYEKYRSAYRLPAGGRSNRNHKQGRTLSRPLVLDFDETPVGDYLELEGHPSDIDRTAALLGYGPHNYIVGSYGGLHIKSLAKAGQISHRGKSQNEPTPNSGIPDMLFRK